MLDLCCFLSSGLSTILYFMLNEFIIGTKPTVEKKANINPLKLFAAWFKILSKKFRYVVFRNNTHHAFYISSKHLNGLPFGLPSKHTLQNILTYQLLMEGETH